MLRFCFFSAAIQAAFQRNHVYAKKQEDMSLRELQEKEEMKDFIFQRLNTFIPLNRDKITRYTEKLREDITHGHKKILRNGQITFGTVQKIVNLYLKYLWVGGRLGVKEEPPHCPVDRGILDKIQWLGESWTKMERGDYEQAIKVIGVKAENEGVSIAQWELYHWNTSQLMRTVEKSRAEITAGKGKVLRSLKDLR